ncbi:MAG: histidine phosphatase family protein, partial [Muribaculum sp.]|nr:histidine phosphatase family protein [Muribaculum sp.]
YSRIYSSPLLRCRELAKYCCGERDVILDADLREMNFGEWEMMRYDSCNDPRIDCFYADYLNYRCPGGESFRDLGDRVKRFISRLDSSDESILVFTHGGVIAHFRILAGMTSPDKPFVNAPGYGSITTLSL